MDFKTKLAKKKSRTEKKENHQRILDIRNSVDTKFRLELTILNFWTKLTHKRYL